MLFMCNVMIFLTKSQGINQKYSHDYHDLDLAEKNECVIICDLEFTKDYI